MKSHLTTLSNGVRVLTTPIPGIQSVTIMPLFHAGSRFERRDERGLSHFLEHMFFKGGVKYPTPEAVASTVDGFGGEMNAFTGKEYVGYYVKCATESVELAADVLGDMLSQPKLDQGDIDRELGVILEEMKMYQDTPRVQVNWEFEKVIFGDTPMGWDQIGTEECLRGMKSEHFQQYLDEMYTTDNVVIAFAGNITPERAEKIAQEYFPLRPGPVRRSEPTSPLPQSPSPQERIQILQKETEQAHLMHGVLAPDLQDDRSYTASVLSTILGGNMSSRMFTKLREQQGLCYSVRTFYEPFTDRGVIITHSGVDLVRAEQASAAITREYELMTQELVTPEELQKGKQYLIGKKALSYEESDAVAIGAAMEQLFLGKVTSHEEYVEKMNAVTAKQIMELSREIFGSEQYHFSLIGPMKGREEAFIRAVEKGEG